ncbi:MAG: NAD(P)-dependent alcohol dehydrogenase [Microthrixaceae bacterium]|nr:NAD(P)-dependent alcohol dehydrogenase [Microthrixaceae bacterium]
MQALQLTQWQHPPELREVPDPEPGPGQLVIKVGGAGACHSDLHLMDDFVEGMVPFELPFTLGHETAGWVDALGDGVTGLEVGQGVAVYGPWGCGRCRRCRVGMENYCVHQPELGAAGGGLGLNGGMASRMLVPDARLVVPLGDLDPAEAAPLTDAALTPYHAILRSMPLLGAGSTAVVVGAGGGLGHMAVSILEALTPTTIIAVDRNESALSLATGRGAAHGVLMGDSAAAEIQSITGAVGATLVLDLVGNDATLALGAAVVGSLGHLTVVGIGGGSLPVGFFTVPYEASVATTYWGSVTELMDVIQLAQQGVIAAQVTRFPLSEGAEVYARLRDGKVRGRAVVVPE